MDQTQLGAIWSWLNTHPWVYAAALLLAGLLAAAIISRVLLRGLKRIIRRTNTKLDDAVVDHLRWPLILTVILVAALLAFKLVTPDHEVDIIAESVVFSVLLVVWIFAMIGISRTFFKSAISSRRGDSTLVRALPLLDNLIMVVLLVLGAFWLLSLWNVNITPLLASAGIVTAAVAFASKDTLANFFGGISIFVDRPYNLGDYIIVGGDERGEVVDIGVRSTRIMTRDDVLITIPNAQMANATIINQSGKVPRFRIRAKIGVGYDSDPDVVEATLLASCQGVNEILPSPKPRVRFRAFGDSSLDFELLFWVDHPGKRGLVMHHVNRNILKGLNAAGVEIPFPQRVVHLPGAQKDEGQPE